AFIQAMAAADQPGAFALPDPHVLHHGVELTRADDGTHFRRRVEPVADAQGAGARGKAIEECLVDLLVHDNPARRRAALPARAEPAPETAFDGQVGDGVVPYHAPVI